IRVPSRQPSCLRDFPWRYLRRTQGKMDSFSRRIEVWAPSAQRVEVIANGERDPLERDSTRPEWWVSSQFYRAGTHYGFIVDDKGPYPDPRSHSQPSGVHGMSCLVNHNAFQWDDSNWSPVRWADAIVYELHIGTF